jgi:hypothetical protein
MLRFRSAALLSLLVVVAYTTPVLARDPRVRPATVTPKYRTPDGRLHGMGALRTPPEVAVRARRLTPGMGPAAALPSDVDFSPFMPPIGDQGMQGSCVAWATTYYAKTYYEGREHLWSLVTTDHQYSPAWTYNQINSGWDGGSFPLDAFVLLDNKGATSLAQQPYNDTDYVTWPSLTQYLQAMPARNNGYGLFFYGEGNGAAARTAMRTALSMGFPIVLAIPIYSDFGTQIHAPYYIYDEPAEGAIIEGYHAICLVGYDDDLAGIGGFKFLNSWGTSFGDSGAAYLSYNFTDNYATEAWGMADRTGYTPQAWAKVLLTHTFRGDLTINLGHGPDGSPDWQMLVHDQQGGSADNLSTYVDVTDYGSVLGQWWVSVYDNWGADTGSLHTFSLIRGAGEIFSTETPLAITDFSTTIAHLSWALDDFILRVVTAAGGTPTSSANTVAVGYTQGGVPQTAYVWDGNDVAVTADAGLFAFATTSSASNAGERWFYGGVPGMQPMNGATLVQRTYYHQLKKLLSTATQTGVALTAGNYVPVSIEQAGLPATVHAYDGMPGTAAVWADRSSAYSYAATSSGSGASQRWASASAIGGTVLSQDTVFGQFWHQYKANLTLNGTDAVFATALLARALFGAQTLPGPIHALWSDWADAASQLQVRDYTDGSPTRRTLDQTTFTMDSAVTAALNYQSYFRISGRVEDTSHNPLEGVRVDCGARHMITQADGLWEFRDLTAGNYNLGAAKVGWHFTPEQLAVEVNETTGDVGDQVFTGTPVPSVTAWSPQGQAVPPTTTIQMTFSMPMNRPTTQAAFSLVQMSVGAAAADAGSVTTAGLAGTFSWSGGSTVMTFRPSSRLAAYRNYKARLDQTATSAGDAPLAMPHEWTFSTGDALAVVSWLPKGKSANVLPQITMGFDRDIDQPSVQAAFSIVPAATGTWAFPNPHTAQFVVTTPLAYDTPHTVTLAASAHGLDGVALSEPFNWHFTTAGEGHVVSATPTGTGVSPGTEVVVTFDQPMSKKPTQEAFSLSASPPVPGTFTWSGGATIMTFHPAVCLANNTTYTINIAATALTQRNTTLQPFTSNFTTGDVVQVTEVAPKGMQALINAPIEVYFDRSVNPATLVLGVSPVIPGSLHWVTDAQVQFRPTSPLTMATKYTVTVTTVQGLDGSTLPRPYSWTFKTHGTPKVLSYQPHGTDIGPDVPVTMVFNVPMDEASVGSNLEVWIERPVRHQITGLLTMLAGGLKLKFVPDDPWMSFADYRVTLRGTARTVDGVALGTNKEWIFQTAEFMAVLAYSPEGYGHPVSAQVAVTFDRDVNQASFAAGFSITPAVAGTFVWDTPTQVRFVPDAPLANGTIYHVTLDAGIAAISGQTLVTSKTWFFKTKGIAPTAVATAVTATGTAGGTVAIQFSLSATATVRAEIMNLAGRVIAVAGTDSPQPAGPNSILWNRRTQLGTKAPGGMYLVRLKVRGQDGSVQNAMVPLQLR